MRPRNSWAGGDLQRGRAQTPAAHPGSAFDRNGGRGMPERIDARPAFALLGGGLLLIGLFITWYQVPATPPAVGKVPVGNAWHVFETLDLVMAAAGIAALYAAWEQLTGRYRFGEGWLLPASLVALVVVASQILDPPPAAGLDPEAATGAWLALAGSASMVVGGILGMANVSFAMELEDRSGGSHSATTRRRATQDA